MKKLVTVLMFTTLFLFTGCFDLDEEVSISDCYGVWEGTSQSIWGLDVPLDANTYFIEITATDFIVYDNQDGTYITPNTYPYVESSDGTIAPAGFGVEFNTFKLKGDNELTLVGETILGSTTIKCSKYTGALPPASWSN